MALTKEVHFGIARKIVSNMTSESWETIPHATITYEADVTELLKEVKKLNAGNTDPSKKVTLNTVMLKIICEGLKAAPTMNTHLEFNRKLVRGCLKYYDHIDISMPMVLPTGEMMTVNMHDMGNKSLSQMTEAINDTIRRAKNSDMNEVMFEVSLDNTMQGLKKGKILQAVRRLYGSKTGKHKVKTLSGKAKKEYYSFLLQSVLQSTISSRAQQRYQTLALFTVSTKVYAHCLRSFLPRQLLLQSTLFRSVPPLLQTAKARMKSQFA